jgi:tetratricopeptide (TPR) repeat protein
MLYEEAFKRGFATDALKLDYTTFLMNQNRLTDAQQFANEIANSSSVPSLVKLLALINQTYITRLSNRNDDLKTVISLPGDSTGVDKVANEYRDYLLSRVSDTTDALKKVISIYKKVPHSLPVALSYARELVRTKQFGKADTVYKQIPQAFLFSPSVLPEFASNLVRLGKDDDAMKLISNLHQHKIYNKLSLELFRDLSYKKNLIEKAEAAQKLLEKSFKDDIGVLWSKGMIALRSGRYDSAYSVFSSLASANPKEPQFTIMMLNTQFLKGDYEQVITDAASQSVPVAFGKLISARAYRKLDKVEDAKKIYEELLTIAKDTLFEPYLEYAQFLLESGDSKKAAETFSSLIAMYEKSPKKNDAGLAMMLNNYAWSAAEDESFDKELVVAAAKKAVTLQPDNPQIMDTYATVLMKSGMFKECAAALKDNALLKKDPSLLFHLGLAFEKSGDKNRAVRTYQEILATADSLLGKNGSVKKAKLMDHLAELQK